MNVFNKLLYITVLAAFFGSCGSKNDRDTTKFSIATNAKKNTFALGDTLKLSLNNPKNLAITSISYQLNNTPIAETAVLNNIKLGTQTITAKVNYQDQSRAITTSIIIVNNQQPKIYNFEIINEYPHDITSYTQGLEFKNDTLYESTGQYGESKLRKIDYKTAKVIKNKPLAKQYFGEGLTLLNSKIYQLTWRENTGFVYDLNTFEKLSSFTYGKSKEGWGLCNDGEKLYKSDGSENIWILDPNTLTEQAQIQVYTNKGKIPALNELEWIDGKIFANIYQRNGVAIINPKNGAVEGVIDFTPLHNKVTQHQGLDVLNGIAYNPTTKTIFVTGKRWDKLFEVKLLDH